MPSAERLLWAKPRRRQFGHLFRRQHPVGPYIADFACLPLRLLIEVDGDSHYRDEAAMLRDRRREAFLEAQSWTVFRATNSEVYGAMDYVLAGIWQVIGACETRLAQER